MFCPNCGTKLPDGAAFCSNCGNKIQAAPVEPVTEIPTQQPAEPVYEQPAPEQPAEPVYEEPAPEQPAPENFTYEYTEPDGQPTPEPAAQVVPDQAPADYMTINIILCVASALTCCSGAIDCWGFVNIAALVTSIIGIVAGNACKKAIAAGDWATAEAKSKTAKTMWIISAVIVGVSILVSIVFVAVFIIASMTNGNW